MNKAMSVKAAARTPDAFDQLIRSVMRQGWKPAPNDVFTVTNPRMPDDPHCMLPWFCVASTESHVVAKGFAPDGNELTAMLPTNRFTFTDANNLVRVLGVEEKVRKLLIANLNTKPQHDG